MFVRMLTISLSVGLCFLGFTYFYFFMRLSMKPSLGFTGVLLSYKSHLFFNLCVPRSYILVFLVSKASNLSTIVTFSLKSNFKIQFLSLSSMSSTTM